MRVTILTPDYKLDQTLVADSSLALDELSIDFKFHRVDESARFAQITITGIKFDFYYFPRASQICIDGDTLGVIVANVPYGTDVTIVFDGSATTMMTLFVRNSAQLLTPFSGALGRFVGTGAWPS